jgi:hypothetical protein
MATTTVTWIDQIAGSQASRKLIERRIAQSGLGIIRALREGKMSIKDAEDDLFNLDTYRAMRRRRLSAHLIEFMQWGMELEDVAELAPGSLESSYGSMERLLLRCITSSLEGKPKSSRR